ncbi:ATP dependent DNA ligase [Chthoniobacter flavus Ellin428]|uniref:DNA ligase (ATP) n=2 Tax=Chthoniobacter flavus TaxID=191863 RepID=B4D2T7_9BACT|nr:ATP dependent DNA ligase [Chthoniobacter flavus Ellin428]TCO86811.1 ATP dependent DNA ligase-like protein [Chthoniobacter flavus]
MEALSVETIPTGKEWQYEPKWDGFRCVAFRDGKSVELQSKSSQSLTRYFPEVAAALGKLKAPRFVLDGEIAVPEGRGFSFDALLQRIHPAASRVKRLAQETPAIFVVFDFLADEKGTSLLETIFSERRSRLEKFAAKYFAGQDGIRLSPSTPKLAQAKKWLSQTGATLDGIMAKRRDLPYRSGERDGMQKIKNFRSADCVVGGFRYGTSSPLVGSLLLGLYDTNGLLNHVGFTSSIAAADRPALTKKLEKLIEPPGFTGSAPGGPSRWNRGKENVWKPLHPKLVVEVCYDHVTGNRFRHGTRLLRWRPDKKPAQCTMDQLDQKQSNLLRLLRS